MLIPLLLMTFTMSMRCKTPVPSRMSDERQSCGMV